MISFGVIKGLIYRVHKYPILTCTTNDNENKPLSFPLENQYDHVVNKYTGVAIHPDIIPFLDGKHHYDEICTELECSPHELDEQLGFIQPFEDSVNHGENQPVETLYEGVAEDNKQSEEGLPQWIVQFIFR